MFHRCGCKNIESIWMAKDAVNEIERQVTH